ncbi:HTH-type transcriptional regulator YodB [Acrocarpospora phusangensis]|uniref:HTH-type transcriptional regulator YodB n=1 Tax=Acrocarpospora phusangensis TaxID=1070424 RepID=A0A919QFQ9_9ACTN|nr:helix-turn-helix domain-containing protein [Acrocarpospora phusangensis]GIH28117.1 HTH-type transcriptional regulator YodB [Acrocarpospora phusangensis]
MSAVDPDGLERHCPAFQIAVELAGRRWNGAILLAAERGAARYREFLTAVPGISERLLTRRLRELTDEGVLARTVVPSTPVQITYALTPKGAELADAVRPLIAWGERWIGEGTRADG